MAAHLQAEHVDRSSYRFFANRKSDELWAVAKLRLPEELRKAPLRTKAEHPTPQVLRRTSEADTKREFRDSRAGLTNTA